MASQPGMTKNEDGTYTLDADALLEPAETRSSNSGIKFEPTDEERGKVKELSIAGIPHDHICLMVRRNDLPITKKTLYKYFRHELDSGIIETNAMVAGSLFKLAISGNVSAQIFWLKCRSKWREDTKGPGLTAEQAAEAVRAAVAAANAVVGGPPDPHSPPAAGHVDPDEEAPAAEEPPGGKA
jgi:hypothetical protein